MNELEEKKKQVIGLYGEMRLSMELHELGWQVHRAYIDEGIDFTITKYYCPVCKKYSINIFDTLTVMIKKLSALQIYVNIAKKQN